MPKTDEGIKLTLKLPEHVMAVLDGWAFSELSTTPQEAAEAFLEELCVNQELRALVADLVRDR
jgi:hypothetical protein